MVKKCGGKKRKNKKNGKGVPCVGCSLRTMSRIRNGLSLETRVRKRRFESGTLGGLSAHCTCEATDFGGHSRPLHFTLSQGI